MRTISLPRQEPREDDSTGDPCGLSLNPGIQIVTHLSMALSILVGSMSIILITTSLHYSEKVQIERKELEALEIEHNLQSSTGKDDSPVYDLNEQILRKLEKLAMILLVSGILSLASTIIQFISALILLCTIHKESLKPTSQFWSAVTIGVIFCLVSSLIILLCFDISPYPYYSQEQLFTLVVTMDLLFLMYSLWIVISLI